MSTIFDMAYRDPAKRAQQWKIQYTDSPDTNQRLFNANTTATEIRAKFQAMMSTSLKDGRVQVAGTATTASTKPAATKPNRDVIAAAIDCKADAAKAAATKKGCTDTVVEPANAGAAAGGVAASTTIA